MSRPKLERLARHEDRLDHCISCGYCYEHCPIYKETRWETDAPRAKLALCYGLITGALEPSEYIAGKLHECFHCKRCEASCSAGVNLTEIFAAARADLRDLGYSPAGTVSQTDHEVCARCLGCVRLCPHEARSFDPVLGQVVTDPVKCQGCGSCLDLCPRAGIEIRRSFGTDPRSQLEKVGCYLKEKAPLEPRAVVFSCSWSNWPGFQAAVGPPGASQRAHETLVTVCAGRLESRTLLETLKAGAWGLLVTACPPDDCEHGGSARARRRVEALWADLDALGVDRRRIALVEVPKGDAKAFGAAVSAFLEEVRTLGPLFPL
ncbi:MAG: hydrogenase iron-sulfur subunit [Polyangia bacterium]|jgi:coenzyme F420-reducing hydrogenase delta subunit/Fe-S-cluster-containing dehydrogenase component|nr:hydrogenase iron-sulfur subunit [Polyangia bacterium]